MNRHDRRSQSPAPADPAQISRWFSEAVAHHQAGRIRDAVQGYRRVLAAYPALPEAHHNLGVALKALGKPRDAATAYAQALTLKPDYAQAHNSLGNVLCDLGKTQSAIQSFERAIALDPAYAEARNNLATVLKDQGRLDEALSHAAQAVALAPDYAEAHNTHGAIQAAQGQHEQARLAFEMAIARDPNHARAHANLGETLRQMGQLERAESDIRRAIAIAPELGMAHNTLGNILRDQERLEDSVKAYEAALAALPGLPEIHDNLGNVLAQLGHSREAESACRKALKLDQNFAKAHNNLGMALKDQGRRAEAEACFRRALDLDPKMAAAHTNLGMAQLYRGDYAQGWQNFEWRWQAGKLAPKQCPQPQWTGESLAGKTLLFHAEQGLGDTLQFIRYAANLAEMGAVVIAEVQAPLVPLLGTVPGVSHVIPLGQAPTCFDVHLPMMSAPMALAAAGSTDIPARIPYITAPPDRTEVWRDRLPVPPGTGRRIGLVWAGDPRPHDAAANAADRRRSIALAQFAPMLDRQFDRFISLQMGAAAAQADALPHDLRPHDPMGEVKDFADTAAIILCLDLVITVDTSVAHLAGALGKPVWILSRFDGCWRWLDSGETSPWYPTARLFRQRCLGDWSATLQKVTNVLDQINQ